MGLAVMAFNDLWSPIMSPRFGQKDYNSVSLQIERHSYVISENPLTLTVGSIS